jgi:methylmalonyl-CoA/ethylmalonyl-CoA epimerase
MKILGMHHVAVATDDIKKYGAIFENIFGLKISEPSVNEANRVSVSFVDFCNAEVEFIQPLEKDSPISKFLEKRGPGIHHICVLVEDLEGALNELRQKDVKLIDDKPHQGAEGSKIAFIHPDSTGGILIELKEYKI